MKSIGQKLIVKALNDSYYPDLNQSVNAETMVNIIDAEAQKTIDFLTNLRDYLDDAVQDTFSHVSGHSTRKYCLLCGGTGEHIDECPRLELNKLLKEIKQ